MKKNKFVSHFARKKKSTKKKVFLKQQFQLKKYKFTHKKINKRRKRKFNIFFFSFLFKLKYKFLVKKLKKFFIISIIKFFEYRSFIKIFFLIIKFHGILKTADMFSEAIIIQLLRKKKITDIIRSCIYFLTRYYVKKRIGGYHILFSGRFTRKDRAMFR